VWELFQGGKVFKINLKNHNKTDSLFMWMASCPQISELPVIPDMKKFLAITLLLHCKILILANIYLSTVLCIIFLRTYDMCVCLLQKRIYIYVYIYTYIYIYIHVHIHTYIHIHTCIYMKNKTRYFFRIQEIMTCGTRLAVTG